MKGIIGKKIGMTSIFDPAGRQTACTIIEAGPCVVTQVKTIESDGYNALQVSFGDKKESHVTKSEKNHFAKASTPAKRFSKEFRDTSLQKNIGDTIRLTSSLKVTKLKLLEPLKERVSRASLSAMDFMVWASSHMVSTTASVPRVHSVTHPMHQG
jgi:hypothetical protein